VKRNVFKIFLFLVAVAISFFVIKKGTYLRKFRYDVYPTPVADEYTYVWQAISLKKYGLPMAWTLNSGVYKDIKFSPIIGDVKDFGIDTGSGIINSQRFKKDSRPLSAVKEIDYQKGVEHMQFVAPFFDHPPLGGLIYSLGVKKDVKLVEEIKPIDFRKTSLVIAIITTILLFIFLTLITSSFWVGTLGVIIYSTVPTYLLASRTAFLENIVSPLVLVSLILLFLYKKIALKKYSLILIIFSGLFGGLSVLAKEPAIGFLFGTLIVLWKNKVKLKNIFIYLISYSFPLLVYAGWGLWLHKDLFMAILLTNASRTYFGAIKVITMLEALKFENFPTDGWWIWGLISFVFISLKQKNKDLLFLTLPLFTHILVVLLLGSGNYSWYWLSTIPFLAGCNAVMIWKIMKNPKVTTVMLFFFIPFSSSYYWGREALGLLPDINHYRTAIFTFGLMLFLRLKFKNLKIIKILWIGFMIWMIYKIIVFNEVFFPYLIANWGKLSIQSLPHY
jgi:4-amino-4-deoxy-L-arabinose transferase-like glycosyltransferase